MKVEGKNIAILIYNYFEQSEFEVPLQTLKKAGGKVTVIAVDSLDLQAMKHASPGDKFTADLLLDQTKSENYDALVLPGGAINADQLREINKAKEWVIDFLESSRPLAIICHAPWVLVSADAVEGHRLTSFPSIRDDIVNAGGEWVDQAVVVDNNLISSRKPDDLPAFTAEILKKLNNSSSFYKTTYASY